MVTQTKQPKLVLLVCTTGISVFRKQTPQSTDNSEQTAAIRQENFGELSGLVLCQDGNAIWCALLEALQPSQSCADS